MPRLAKEDQMLQGLSKKEEAITRQIAELQKDLEAIRRVKQLSTDSTPTAPRVVSERPAESAGTFAGLGASEAARKLFAQTPGKTWGPAELTRELVRRGWKSGSKNRERWSTIIGETLKHMHRRGELSRQNRKGRPLYGWKKGISKSRFVGIPVSSARGYKQLGPLEAAAKLLQETDGRMWRPAKLQAELLKRGWKSKAKNRQTRTSIISASLKSLSEKGLAVRNGEKGKYSYGWKSARTLASARPLPVPVAGDGYRNLGAAQATRKLLQDTEGNFWTPAEFTQELFRRGWKRGTQSRKSSYTMVNASLRRLYLKGKANRQGGKGSPAYGCKKVGRKQNKRS